LTTTEGDGSALDRREVLRLEKFSVFLNGSGVGFEDLSEKRDGRSEGFELVVKGNGLSFKDILDKLELFELKLTQTEKTEESIRTTVGEDGDGLIIGIGLAKKRFSNGLDEVGALEREVKGGRIMRIVLEDKSIRLEKIKVAAGSISVIDLSTLFVIASGIDDEEGLSVNLSERSDSSGGLVVEHVGKRSKDELSVN